MRLSSESHTSQCPYQLLHMYHLLGLYHATVLILLHSCITIHVRQYDISTFSLTPEFPRVSLFHLPITDILPFSPV